MSYLKGDSKVEIRKIRPILKLTGRGNFREKDYSTLEEILHEAGVNNFEVIYQEKVVKRDENKGVKYIDFIC
ncbi:hypothetical protein [Sulfuracidifex tepidarius]|uniref:Uncharacterized protein n=1 Tax=Sulfuracidifex tepidarius TaxID=1294262 RepID=A0A510E5L9_9CREN|nr:hypothetical protein [Sulfuracidifex tepidarius]BBG27835.1 hypothetical protein IC007_2390 [Sulfuracidifex tepidarius]